MATEFIAGCVGGCAGVAVGHPFDTIKVKIQTQDAFNPKYRGTWHCFTQTLKSESVRGLYKGMSSPMAGVAVINGIIFGVHGSIMKRVSNPNSISSHALAGAGAGLSQAFIASPTELAKTRIQLQSNTGFGHKSPLSCLKSIYKTEGIKGIFRGQSITVMREIPAFALYFASYELLLRKLSSGDDISTMAILMAGGLAGTASWVLTYPLDVIKSRIQADGMNGINQYKGIWQCLQSSVHNEGFSVLSRGMSSAVLRSFPTNAAVFYVVSWVVKLGEETEHRYGDSAAAWKDVIARGEIIVSAATAPIMNKVYPCIMQHQNHLLNLRMLSPLNFASRFYSAEPSN